jgi:phospholipase/lecithinase/hemolysin
VHTDASVLIVRSDFEVVVEEKFQTWNTSLRNAAQEFGKNHPEATVLLFSSFEAFDTFLNKPEDHGFHPEDVKRRNGSIWMDHIHPTSKVHDYIACRLATFLESIQPVSKEDV